jgi:hypothetical protein
MKTNNGNLPANPFTQEPYPIGAIGDSYGPMATGLTKREMFAMAAMQGLLANATVKLNIGPTGSDNLKLGSVAVSLADALLAGLEKTKCAD